jgi:threonyl-tRNA synthetase
MMKITLPDGSEKQFDHPVSAHDVAASIGTGLAKAAIGAKVDGELADVHRKIERDAKLEIITEPRKNTPMSEQSADALYLLRHSCAHVMAEAIQRLWPAAQLAYGPPLENGFYYDIALDEPISSDDFTKIEAEMEKIVEEDRPFTRYDLDPTAGMQRLNDEGNKYKIDNAKRAIAGGADSLSWYVTGEKDRNWEDLCMGPHLPSTKRIGAFKVMSIASSHWHGDVESDRFQRVYGTAFFKQADLDDYLERLEQAKQRDHRVIGQKLNLFTIDEKAGQGLILWKPAGAVIRQQLQNFIMYHLERQGYHQVFTPHIGKLELYKTSGHFPYYQDSQFPPLIDADQIKALANEGCTCAELANLMKKGDIDGYLLRPMNCPHHIRIYSSEKHSYRDLPVRLAEFGTVYRWEQSGELGGMTRVRGFTQDDAHLFCTEEQLEEEVLGCLELVKIIFATLGMDDYRVRVGLRDPDDAKYVGNPRNWDKAEAACRKAAESLGKPFVAEEGEAAFYGPKIDFVVKDVIGREWQLGTVQVDYNLPERFDLSYVGADNAEHRPVMIHRAPFGSMERFIGVLIEHFAGAFPLWLSPEQVRVLPVSDKFMDYATKVTAALKDAGLRVTLDDSNERVNAKIRVAQDDKVPYMLVVGGRDADAGTVSVRERAAGDLGALPLDVFIEQACAEIETHGKKTVTVTAA